MKTFLAICLVVLILVGGCGGCLWVANYFLSPTPPTAEQAAHYDEMAKKLAEAQPGDFVIFEGWYDCAVNDKSVGVVRWRDYERRQLGIAELGGRFNRVSLDDIGPGIEDVVLKNDPRWPWFRDRLIFGKKEVTTRSAAKRAN